MDTMIRRSMCISIKINIKISDYPRCEFTEECTKDEDCGGSDRDSRYI